MSFTGLKIEEYSERSVVVYGETRKYKEDLKKLGGKYNVNLKNGSGWIFPKSSKKNIINFINKGERLVTLEEEKAGEESSKQSSKDWEKNKKRYEKTYSPVSPTISEYGVLISAINKMKSKIDVMEQTIMKLLDSNQQKKFQNLMKTPKNISNVVTNVERSKITTNDSEDINDSEDEIVPRKRLLVH